MEFFDCNESPLARSTGEISWNFLVIKSTINFALKWHLLPVNHFYKMTADVSGQLTLTVHCSSLRNGLLTKKDEGSKVLAVLIEPLRWRVERWGKKKVICLFSQWNFGACNELIITAGICFQLIEITRTILKWVHTE